MKTRFFLIQFSLACSTGHLIWAQAAFQNLNFEEANPVPVVGSPYYPYDVTVASGLPHWTVSLGGVQQTQMFYNDYALGATQVTLVGSDPALGDFPIDGNYSVLLQGGLTASSAAISQTGLIPGGTQSFYLETQPPAPAVQGPLELQIGNQFVSLASVATGPNYTLYGANIAAWAGDTEPLTLSTVEGYGGGNNWLIDDISFSSSPLVPEPSVVSLATIGGLLFTCRKLFIGR